MTELRKRMIECLQLRGLAERTQKSYLRAVRQLAAHYHKSPALITESELRQYFLHLLNDKHYARHTMTIAICGIRFCYEQTLNRRWSIFDIVRPAPEKKLPVIPQSRRGATDSRWPQTAALPRLSQHHLLVRSALAGRLQSARRRYRQRPHYAPRPPRQGC